MTMNLYTLDQPRKWKAGTVGKDQTPFYFDCGACGAKEPEIHGFAGTGPTYPEIAIIRQKGSVFVNPAMFCRACYAEQLRLASPPVAPMPDEDRPDASPEKHAQNMACFV
jgi:hypothetical protein